MMPKKHVLVAEDDPDTREVVATVIASAGYQVSMACNGEEVLQMARRSHPDVVVLDVNMPMVDGITVAKELREDGDAPDLRIVMYTALREREIRKRFSGYDAYLPKPSNIQSLLDAVAGLVAHR